jgi:cytoskeletal protein RodZ
MSEENVPNDQAKTEPQSMRVGDMLRNERITRRIALETIAKDLKLNVRYVRSLEANDYNDLPADPYVRVYLRSLAKYLLLDPEAILKKFYEERGIHDEKFRKGSDTRIAITMVEKEKKKDVKPWMIILGVIVALALVSFLANKRMGASSDMSKSMPVTAGRAETTQIAVRKTAATDASEDSLIGKMVRHDSASPPADTAKHVAVAAKDTVTPFSSGSLSIEIRAKKDSVWVQVFADGVSWKNWLKPNQVRRSFARDSFNIHVGNNSLLEYTFNGKPLKIDARDVAIFKLDRFTKDPEIWTLAKWNSVFKDRN